MADLDGDPAGSLPRPSFRSLVSPDVGDGGTDQTLQAERLVLQMASLGSGISAAMAEAIGSPEFVTNAPLLVLCLLDLDGPARPSAIAGVVGLTSGGTTKLLDRLEEAGLIERSYGAIETDHRGVQVAVTAAGRRTLRTAAGALVEHLPDVSDLVANIVALLDDLGAR